MACLQISFFSCRSNFGRKSSWVFSDLGFPATQKKVLQFPERRSLLNRGGIQTCCRPKGTASEEGKIDASAMATTQRLLSIGSKIVGVGRNYAAHAKELGNAVPKEPVLFLKPTSSYLQNGGTIEIPHPLESLDHEVELAVVIGQKARDITEETAMDYVGGYALALDMTAREIQSSAKSAGLPWTVAKGQDTFTPISEILPTSLVADPNNLELWLKIDDEIKQKGSTKDMIFKIPFLVSHISSIMTLLEGDVILTGTPQGVGPVKAGQKLTAGITGLIDIYFDVQKRPRPGNRS